MTKIPKTDELFDTGHSIAKVLLEECEYPYEALPKIADFISECAARLDRSFMEIQPGVFVTDDAVVWPGATLVAPAIIGHKAEIRPGAFIRGNVIVGDGAVIGNSTEIKNSIILDGAQLPHYNYVGDSIIGYKAHMGAGAIASNLRLDKGQVSLSCGEERLSTGLKKVGVMLGDYAEVGCGSVLCPGAVVGREAVIYPLSCVKGVIAEKSVYKGGKVDA